MTIAPKMNFLYRHVAARWSSYRKRRDFDHWLESYRKRGSDIHRSLEITGAPNYKQNIAFGAQCNVERDVTIWLSTQDDALPRLQIADRVFVGRNSYLGAHQPITINDNTLIGAYSYVISANHRFDLRVKPIRDQGYTGAPVNIESDVWIGTHVVILPGVRIARGAIIAAGSIVNRNVGAYEIWGGTPARLLKQRP